MKIYLQKLRKVKNKKLKKSKLLEITLKPIYTVKDVKNEEVSGVFPYTRGKRKKKKNLKKTFLRSTCNYVYQ